MKQVGFSSHQAQFRQSGQVSVAARDYDPTCEIAHKRGLTARRLAAEDLAKI